jgi:NTE family protein
LFIAPYAGAGIEPFDVVVENEVVARYEHRSGRAGLRVGFNLGAQSDLRIGTWIGHASTTIQVGDPSFPELRGDESGGEILWRMDTQDSPIVPGRGTLSEVRLSRFFTGPDVTDPEQTFDFDQSATQLSAVASRFWTVRQLDRLFVYGGVGTSFDSSPVPTRQFAMGTPFRLGAYGAGELRGPNYFAATGGYLRRIGRLPDFIGGPVYAGAWLENGDAFEEWEHAGWRTNGGAGIVMDTLVGPAIVAGSWSFDGRWRTYLGIGRLFR